MRPWVRKVPYLFVSFFVKNICGFGQIQGVEKMILLERGEDKWVGGWVFMGVYYLCII